MEGKDKRFIEEMNAIEVRNMINEKTIAIMVLGACENHGDHMPFGSDFIFPTEIAKRVATKVSNVIVLPAIPYGVSMHHDKFQMTMSFDPETMIGIISDILSSLDHNKIRRVLIINGHDGNIGPIEIAARTMKNKNPEMIIACLESWWVLVGQLKKDLLEIWNAPEEVIPKLPENIRIFWKFDELTSTGATGSPQKATIRKGNEILQLLEDVLISFIKEMESTDWKYGIYLK
jgi:creatinine amidohydrolase